jgi:hypothetical protein
MCRVIDPRCDASREEKEMERRKERERERERERVKERWPMDMRVVVEGREGEREQDEGWSAFLRSWSSVVPKMGSLFP